MNVDRLLPCHCAFLRLILSAQNNPPPRFCKRAAIINHLPAKKSLFYHSAEDLAGIRRQLVAVMNHFRLNSEFSIRRPNQEVGITTNSNRALSLPQTDLPGRSRAKPIGQSINFKASRAAFSPHHRQTKLQGRNPAPGLHKIALLTQFHCRWTR